MRTRNGTSLDAPRLLAPGLPQSMTSPSPFSSVGATFLSLQILLTNLITLVSTLNPHLNTTPLTDRAIYDAPYNICDAYVNSKKVNFL